MSTASADHSACVPAFGFIDYLDGSIVNYEGHDEAFVARLGLGVDAHLNESWVLGGEVVYVLGTDSLRLLEYATTNVVLTYKFF